MTFICMCMMWGRRCIFCWSSHWTIAAEQKKTHTQRTNLIFKFNTNCVYYVQSTRNFQTVKSAQSRIEFHFVPVDEDFYCYDFYAKLKAICLSLCMLLFSLCKTAMRCIQVKTKNEDGRHRCRRHCHAKRTTNKETLTNKNYKKWHPILCAA